MAKRQTRRQRRRARIHRYLTVLSVAVLVAGSVYFVHGKLANDHVIDTNARLSESFHAAKDAADASREPELPAAATAVPALAPDAVATAVPNESAPENVLPALQPDGGAVSLVRRLRQSEPEVVAVEPVVSVAPVELQQDAVVDQVNPFDMPVAVDAPLVRVMQSEFEQLYAENNDLIGWIKMADSVDYPLLWRDNSFYMDHDFYGQYSQAGSIFLDARNDIYMTDSAMLIYGHNMRSGVMFGDLDKYRKTEYLKQYPLIEVQSAWESEPRQYVLISLFDASMNKSDPSYIRIVRTSFEDDADKEAFIADMRARSKYKIPLEADAGDQLLTLVTCSYNHDNGRFLLFARELRDGETADSIREIFQNQL